MNMALLARLTFLKALPWGNRLSIKKNGYLGTNDRAISLTGMNLGEGSIERFPILALDSQFRLKPGL